MGGQAQMLLIGCALMLSGLVFNDSVTTGQGNVGWVILGVLATLAFIKIMKGE